MVRHVVIESEFADLRMLRRKPASLVERIGSALELYPADLLFIHRDAENQDPEARLSEIEGAVQTAAATQTWVGVVPVRMTEAWLLIDESAIRTAADNPNGEVALALPALSELERLPDPKRRLRELLEKACEKRGRRLEQFRRDLPWRVQRVAQLIQNFAKLGQLTAFRRLQRDTRGALAQVRPDLGG
jgi:hypothetical protein